MTTHVTALGTPLPLATERRSVDPQPIGVALLAFLLGLVYLQQAVNWRQAALFVVGVGAGVVLYHAAFGFTSAWRVFISDRRGAGLRAQMLMLALTCLLFFPALGSGSLFGQPVRGSVSPAGVSVLVGAFLFGVGMQLGGGCASGTLYTAGGGNTRMLVTLIAFIVGSVVGAAHMPLWEATPALKSFSLVARLGPLVALAISLSLFGAIAAATMILERRRHGELRLDFGKASACGPRRARRREARASGGGAPRALRNALRHHREGRAGVLQGPALVGQGFSLAGPDASRSGWARVLQGPWPLVAGAVGLTVVNFSTLALAGRPWGVTSAFALWGSKAAATLGMDVASWPYWSSPARAAELKASVFADVTSVMDFGIILGALAAAGFAGRFAPTWRVPTKSLVAAVTGGLLLGYGARIAYGCNIGAYFSGMASGSLHAWLWLIAGFSGNILGTRLRPLFGLRVERTKSGGVQ